MANSISSNTRESKPKIGRPSERILPIFSKAAWIFAATSIILKFSWYDKLGPGEMYLPDAP